MDYSAAERERAAEQIAEMEMVCLPKFNLLEHEGVLGLQMELNRAVDLLRRTTHSPEPGERYPLWKSIQDFLSHYPEGELR